MDVQTIHSRVLDISIDEDSSDNTLSTFILYAINAAYRDVYTLALKQAATYFETTETLSLTSGVVTLTDSAMKVILAKHDQSDTVLTLTTKAEITAKDPGGTSTGTPLYYYVSDKDQKLHCWPTPTDGDTITVQYIPEVAELTLDSLESDIKFAPRHHDVLFYGAITKLALYERGFTSERLKVDAEIQFQRRVGALMSELINTNSPAPTTVSYY